MPPLGSSGDAVMINTTLKVTFGWLRRARNSRECVERVEADRVSPRNLGGLHTEFRMQDSGTPLCIH